MEPEYDNSYLNSQDLARVLLYTLLMFILSIFFGAAMVLLGGPKMGMLAETLFIIPAIILVVRRKMPFARTFRLNPITLPILFYTLLLTVPVLILGDVLDRLFTSFFPLPAWFDIGDLMAIHSVWDGILIIGNGVIVAGIAEEMLFRGLVQRSLEHFHDIARAIALSAIFFAMLHFNIWWMFQITLLGLVLGYIAWKSNSLWPAIFLHCANNLVSILCANTAKENLAWYELENHVRWVWIAVSLVILIPGIYGFKRACSARHNITENDRIIGGNRE
jgi:membrane protease YdiL (CAAX protease family)